MVAHDIGRALGLSERGPPFRRWRRTAFGTLTVGALLLQGCAAAPPQPVAGPDSSNAHSVVPPARHQPVITGASGLRPVTPRDWREQNEGVTPSRTQ